MGCAQVTPTPTPTRPCHAKAGFSNTVPNRQVEECDLILRYSSQYWPGCSSMPESVMEAGTPPLRQLRHVQLDEDLRERHRRHREQVLERVPLIAFDVLRRSDVPRVSQTRVILDGQHCDDVCRTGTSWGLTDIDAGDRPCQHVAAVCEPCTVRSGKQR